MIKKLYLLDNKISWKTFKELQKKLVDKSGVYPKQGDRMLWELLRDKKIYCWFDPEREGDMGIGIKLPVFDKFFIIKSN